MPNEHDGDHKKLLGYYEGEVVDNVDPKKLGRVRVNLPGIAEPTGWAFPAGMPGGGGKKRGTRAPPPKGAEVGVMFKMGDPEHPRYFGGHQGEGEAADEIDEASPEDAVKVPYVFEGARYKIIVDERPGKMRCALIDKKLGDMYELDGEKGGLKLKSSAAMSIECDGALDVKASSITFNGRKLAPNNKPIS